MEISGASSSCRGGERRRRRNVRKSLGKGADRPGKVARGVGKSEIGAPRPEGRAPDVQSAGGTRSTRGDGRRGAGQGGSRSGPIPQLVAQVGARTGSPRDLVRRPALGADPMACPSTKSWK